MIWGYAKIYLLICALGISLMIVNALQILNLALYPFFRKLYYRNAFLIPPCWSNFCCFCLRKFFNFSFQYRGPDLHGINNAVVIANHQTAYDVPIIFWMAGKFHKGQYLRWFAKSVFKHVPLIGWGVYLSHAIFLRRNWARDKHRLAKALRHLITNSRPFWVAFFPEGTRITPEKRRQSQDYCRKNSYPLLKNVLLPRPMGFITTINTLRPYTESLLDITIHYADTPPRLRDMARGKPYHITVHCDVIPISTLPADTVPDLKHWLNTRFVAKDELLAEYTSETHKKKMCTSKMERGDEVVST